MENLLISACLCGENCRYDGKNNLIVQIDELRKKYNLIIVCPEVLGGLSTPRVPAEIIGGKVINKIGKDVTYEFELGAKKSLELAKKYNCKIALLKDKSPSCGSKKIYDGTHRGKLINGRGFTAKILLENNIKIYGEENVNELLKN